MSQGLRLASSDGEMSHGLRPASGFRLQDEPWRAPAALSAGHLHTRGLRSTRRGDGGLVGCDICVGFAACYEAGVSRVSPEPSRRQKMGKGWVALSRLRNEEDHRGTRLKDGLPSRK